MAMSEELLALELEFDSKLFPTISAITRPAIANERLKRNHAGQVVLQLKSPYKDGTTHIVMEPLEFMERLAALVPRPRLHLIRFHGVLAPNAKLRSKIVPAPAERAAAPPTDHASAQEETPRMSWARLLKRVFDIDVEHCPNCGGALKIIAAIDDPPVIIKILSHLGLPTRGPTRRAPARRQRKGNRSGSGLAIDSAEKPVNIICHRHKQTLRVAK